MKFFKNINLTILCYEGAVNVITKLFQENFGCINEWDLKTQFLLSSLFFSSNFKFPAKISWYLITHWYYGIVIETVISKNYHPKS